MGRALVFCALAYGAYMILLQPSGSRFVSTSAESAPYVGAANGAVSGVKASANTILK